MTNRTTHALALRGADGLAVRAGRAGEVQLDVGLRLAAGRERDLVAERGRAPVRRARPAATSESRHGQHPLEPARRRSASSCVRCGRRQGCPRRPLRVRRRLRVRSRRRLGRWACRQRSQRQKVTSGTPGRAGDRHTSGARDRSTADDDHGTHLSQPRAHRSAGAARHPLLPARTSAGSRRSSPPRPGAWPRAAGTSRCSAAPGERRPGCASRTASARSGSGPGAGWSRGSGCRSRCSRRGCSSRCGARSAGPTSCTCTTRCT